jgi:hypothetical protein
VNKEQVPKIPGFAVMRERKEEKVNKEQAQEILLSGIVVQDHNEPTEKNKEFRAQRDD